MAIPGTPNRFENRVKRRLFLVGILVPPTVSVIASAVGLWSLDASIVVIAGAALTALAALLDYTLEAASNERNQVRVYAKDETATTTLLAQIADSRPKEVDLLEYSANGALSMLGELATWGSVRRIRLLICHPDSALSAYQRDVRLVEGLRGLAYRIPVDLAEKCGLEIRCYKEPASMRGKLIGRSILSLGWYTFDDRGMPDSDGKQMSGGSNCSVIIMAEQPGASAAIDVFSRVFENQWRTAVPVAQAWAPRVQLHPQLPSKEWLRVVSGPTPKVLEGDQAGPQGITGRNA